MNLRPYQSACLDQIGDRFNSHQSTIAVLATGLGKTVIFSHLANRMDQRKVMILAHREELVTQAAGKIRQICGEEPGIEMGAMRSDHHTNMYNRSHVIVGSVQTLSRDRRRAKFCPADFGLLVIDEAHHATGDSYRKVIDHFCSFSHCKLLGVTATPNRADELALGAVFQSEAFNYGIEEAVSDGWLVPIHQEVVKVHGLDFSKVRTTKGDLDPVELESILTEEKALHAIAGPTVELAGDKPTLVFCVGVKHAQLMAEVICRYKKSDTAAVVIHGETPKEERRELVKKYKAGDIQFLTNCGIFLEGFDAPATSFISMARPTKSLPLYTQVVGRGTRALPGVIDGLEDAPARRNAIEASGKPFMTVLDFVGNAGRHKLVTSADVLGGRYPQEDREEAREDAAEVGGDIASALLVAKLHRELKEDGFDAIQASIEREAKDDQWLFEQQEVRRDITGEANYSTRSVDPFNSADRSHSSSSNVQRDPPSKKQISMLVYLGVPRATAYGYSKRQASAVIGNMLAKGVRA